jgi:uncharacterized protein YxjI
MDFPLDLRFKTLALAPQISVTDAQGRLLYYVRQKAFKLRESITVFADAEQTRALYRVEADRVIDFGARYTIEDADTGATLGAVRRRGLRSIWRAHYEVERGGATVFEAREENPWIKVADGLLGELPVVGLLSGYLLHPAYRLTAAGGAPALRMKKAAALFEGRYTIERAAPAAAEADERLAVLGLLMLVLLERSRG